MKKCRNFGFIALFALVLMVGGFALEANAQTVCGIDGIVLDVNGDHVMGVTVYAAPYDQNGKVDFSQIIETFSWTAGEFSFHSNYGYYPNNLSPQCGRTYWVFPGRTGTNSSYNAAVPQQGFHSSGIIRVY